MTEPIVQIEWKSEDLARLHRTLERLELKHWWPKAADAIGLEVRGVMAKYPPTGPYNRPPYPYYQRGYGTVYAPAEGSRARRGRQTSQKMNLRWYHTVYPDYLVIGNDATYAPYIHGAEQVWWAPRHGWRKLLDVAKNLVPHIIKKLEAQAVKIWEETR